MRKSVTLLTIALIFYHYSQCQPRIAIEEVSSNIGKRVTVCGKISGLTYEDSKSKMALMTMGTNEGKSRLTLVVHASDNKKMDGNLEMFTGKSVCATGKLVKMRGKTQLLVEDNSNIQIHSQGGGSEIRLKDFLPFE